MRARRRGQRGWVTGTGIAWWWAALALLVAPGLPGANRIHGQDFAAPQDGFLETGPATRPLSAGDTTPIGREPSLGLARDYLDAGRASQRARLPEAVDLYYRAVVVAYACLVDQAARGPALDGELVGTYNEALARCLKAAAAADRLDPRARLMVTTPSGLQAVPVRHVGFVWQPRDFHELIDPGDLKGKTETKRSRRRAGVGANQVVVRHRAEGETFLALRHPFPATAVLHPDLEVWWGRSRGPCRDRLDLVDPLRMRAIVLGDRSVPLAGDPDSIFLALQQWADANKLKITSLLRPGRVLDRADLYMIEPYQPGKVPVVLVHGLASSPLTWSDMVGDLRADPVLLQRCQIWMFAYPTGQGIMRNARILREALYRIEATYNPDGRDPALSELVLVGHSMGGLLSKLQTSSSQQIVWNTFFTLSPQQVRMPRETRAMIQPALLFEPVPVVSRVVFIATPHRGSQMAQQMVGRLTSSLIRTPDDAKAAFRQIAQDNPGALAPGFHKPPTSVDMLEPDHPLLLAMLRLPRAEGVPYHSIIGTGKTEALRGEVGDGVVPVPSARVPGVASEVFVDATHTTIHHQPETVAEVRRILFEHLGTNAGRGMTAPPGATDELVPPPESIGASATMRR